MIRRKQIGVRLSDLELRMVAEIQAWCRADYHYKMRHIDRTGVIVLAIERLHHQMSSEQRNKESPPTKRSTK